MGLCAGQIRVPYAKAIQPRALKIRGVTIAEVIELADYNFEALQGVPEGNENGFWTNLDQACTWNDLYIGKVPMSSTQGFEVLQKDLEHLAKLWLCEKHGLTSTGPHPDPSNLKDEELILFMRVLLARYFVMTNNGHIGIGPRHTKVGDKAVIFDGGETAFILRSVRRGDNAEKSCRLIGDCYMNGWMDGTYCRHHIIDVAEEERFDAVQPKRPGFLFRQSMKLLLRSSRTRQILEGVLEENKQLRSEYFLIS
ncbi:hypothetical protein EK21DRAFT_112278 [Setomelanomma holmii]|uniref:Uncharacterized protein n=1 Tax=Setomelanomma holmii TaxID=210430 RepID=A0A9P4HB46_9PLEO|nr:hypothetical protein EK21DRAFT_112278 [Setomelanomma holmii]